MRMFGERLRLVVSVAAANADVRRGQFAYAAFGTAQLGSWVAILVYAYHLGGATQTGVAAVVQLVPAAVFAPFAAQLGDRFPRERVLLAAYLAQTCALALTAVVLWQRAPVVVVYLFAALVAMSETMPRPVHSALLPSLVETPEELTAANVTTGWIDGLAALVGPLAAAILLALGGPTAVFAILALVAAAGALLALRVRVRVGSERVAENDELLVDALAGFRAVARDPGERVVVGVSAATSVLYGALDVLTVVLAFALLGLGPGGPGYLNAALGLGALVGAGVAVMLIGRRRLAPPLLAGVVGAGLALVLIGLAPTRVLAPLLLIGMNAGSGLSDIAGRTLLQRVAHDDVLARVFGVLEGVTMAAYATGAAAAAVAAASLGGRAAFIAAGAFVPLVALLGARTLLRADRAAEPRREELALLLADPIFAPLSAPVLERLCRDMAAGNASPGTALIREGDAGDYLFLLAEGSVEVTQAGRRLGELGPGSSFGEIALLDDVPRTATVTAMSPVRFFTLAREPFLEAVTGHPRSLQEARSVVRERRAR